MNDDVSKLPAWPESIDAGASVGQEFDWLDQSLTAALARMEALVEYAEHTDSWTYGCASLGATTKAWTDGKRGCTCGLDALLAACERSHQ
jgi:hypothetical protein